MPTKRGYQQEVSMTVRYLVEEVFYGYYLLV